MILLSIQTSQAQPIWVNDQGQQVQMQTGIFKRAVSTLEQPKPISVHQLGLAGDVQVDKRFHGGVDKAVYVFPVAHYDFWSDFVAPAVEKPLPFGFMGENFTISGLNEEMVYVGDRWRVGECEFEVTMQRRPCLKFNAITGREEARMAMYQSGKCGWYMAVVTEGCVQAGDKIAVIAGERKHSIRALADAYALEKGYL